MKANSKSQGTMAKSFRKERGIVLVIALILLVAMTLTGIALLRQIGTGVIVAANLTFRQAAAVSSDRGGESARAWLVAQGATTLQAAAAGYYPAWCHDGVVAATTNCNGATDFNPATFNWTNNAVLETADDGAGNEVRWVIHRLCDTQGALNVANQRCVTIGSTSAGGSKAAATYGTQALTNTSQPYFRVTSRVRGPRNNLVYTQTIMY